MQLRRSTQAHICGQLGDTMHMDYMPLHDVRRRMSTLKLDHEKQSFHNVRRRMSTLILDHEKQSLHNVRRRMSTLILEHADFDIGSARRWIHPKFVSVLERKWFTEFICTLTTLYTISHDSVVGCLWMKHWNSLKCGRRGHTSLQRDIGLLWSVEVYWLPGLLLDYLLPSQKWVDT